MDFVYYAILAVIVCIMVLAAYSFVSADVPSWGPDLTDELPAYLLNESFKIHDKGVINQNFVTKASRPTPVPSAPLLIKVLPTRSKRVIEV